MDGSDSFFGKTLIKRPRCWKAHTMILIAMSFPTIISYYEIFAAKSGQIIEFCSHYELLSKGRIHKELFERGLRDWKDKLFRPQIKLSLFAS